MTTQKYARKFPLLLGAIVGSVLLGAGVSQAQTCFGSSVTVTLPAGGGSYDYSDNNRDVIWGSSGNDIVNMDICDAFCGNDGADDAIVDDNTCTGGFGVADFDGGNNGDDMFCSYDCNMVGGGGNDRLFVNGSGDASLNGGSGNDRFQINTPGTDGGSPGTYFFTGGADTDTMDCNFWDEGIGAGDDFFFLNGTWDTTVDTTDAPNCAD